jgi:hypothetical protein
MGPLEKIIRQKTKQPLNFLKGCFIYSTSQPMGAPGGITTAFGSVMVPGFLILSIAN